MIRVKKIIPKNIYFIKTPVAIKYNGHWRWTTWPTYLERGVQ